MQTLNLRENEVVKCHLDGFSPLECSKIFYCSRTAIRKILHKFGVARNMIEAHKRFDISENEVINYYDDGNALSECAKKFECSQTSIYRILHKSNVLRSLRESHLGDKNHFYGKHHTTKTKKKISKKVEGRFGTSSPNWKGGISFDPYCIKFTKEFKERVREFFDRKCYVCGKSEEGLGRKLDIHHVNYDKMVCCNNVKPLFVPLCRSCHSKTGSDRESWEEFFTISISYLTQNKCYYTEEEKKKETLIHENHLNLLGDDSFAASM